MIEGTVNDVPEAIVALSLHGPAGRMIEVDAIVDTGFTGFLTLPSAVVAELDLPFVFGSRATLADGSETNFDTYRVTVLWEGRPRPVLADEADTTPLVGMALLDNHTLFIEVEEGGRVAIQAKA